MREVSISGYSTASGMKEPKVRKNRQAYPVDKLSYLQDCLHAQSEGHKRRLTEVKAQNQKRLNSIRRMLDQASSKPSFSSNYLPTSSNLARGTRISEPVSPAPEKAVTQHDQNDQESISPYYVSDLNIPKSSNLNQIQLTTKVRDGDSKETEGVMKSSYSMREDLGRDARYLENSVRNPLIRNEFKSNLSTPENNVHKLTFAGIPNRLEVTPKLAKKAGHLAITVLKSYYADNGQYLIEQPKSDELHDRIDQLSEAKLVAEELVGSLQEKVEDLRIEIKGLTNERKDTKRRHEEQISACEKKYESQVRAHRERIAELERQLEKSNRSSRKNSMEKKNQVKPPVPLHSRSGSNKNSTQFDQVIPALFSLGGDGHHIDGDAWVSEADKPSYNAKHERADSRDGQEFEDREERVQQLQDQVRELEIELESWRTNVEELKEQYTMEKSRRLNVMWSLDAKSRQVKNLLSVEEKHSQLIVKFNRVMMANVMLRNQLEGKTGRTFDNGASMKKALERLDQTKESKFALLKDSNSEILRLRGILKRAVQRHPDLNDIVECPVDDFNSVPRLNRLFSPFALGNAHAISGKDKHARSQTVNVNVPSPLLGRSYPANKNMSNTRAQNQRVYRKFEHHSASVRDVLGVVDEEAKLGYNERSRTYREDEDITYRGKESAEG